MTYTARNGRTYAQREGSRVQVARGVAYQTSGGLVAKDIMFNSKTGRYVSKRKHEWGKKKGKSQLAAAGYGLFTKGSAGNVVKLSSRRRR